MVENINEPLTEPSRDTNLNIGTNKGPQASLDICGVKRICTKRDNYSREIMKAHMKARASHNT